VDESHKWEGNLINSTFAQLHIGGEENLFVAAGARAINTMVLCWKS
jgi:hypothetical protein